MRLISRKVWILSFISMFADIASEMLYPIIPVYLKNIGFSILLIGLLEGIAEFTVGLSKGYFGKLSDEKGVRIPFIKWGYFLSALSKPMMALFTNAFWVLTARTTDRLGKGIRTAARDAMLSDEATIKTKATVFGFHRTWDTAGAIIGPVIALLFLNFFPSDYQNLFFLAAIPGMIAVLLVFILKEKKQPAVPHSKKNFFSFFGYWKQAHPHYRILTKALLVFAIANSSDIFLLLRVKEITGSDSTTISVYILYNIIFAVTSLPLGMLADKLGIKKVFLAGLLVFAAVYTGFGFAVNELHVYVLFVLYGLYAAATEGIAKAWITNLADKKETATAIGLYTSLQSMATLLASVLAGILWTFAGSTVVFLMSGLIAIMVFLYLLFTISRMKP